jgi:nitrogen regulatory protein PII
LHTSIVAFLCDWVSAEISSPRKRRVKELSPMKAVVAIIRPRNLDEVHDALHAIEISDITICEILKHQHKKGHSAISQSVEHGGHFRARLRVEVIVSDELVKQVVEIISSIAGMDSPGDGMIFVHTLDQVGRI